MTEMRRFYSFAMLLMVALCSMASVYEPTLSGDGEVNIADVNAVINIILS